MDYITPILVSCVVIASVSILLTRRQSEDPMITDLERILELREVVVWRLLDRYTALTPAEIIDVIGWFCITTVNQINFSSDGIEFVGTDRRIPLVVKSINQPPVICHSNYYFSIYGDVDTGRITYHELNHHLDHIFQTTLHGFPHTLGHLQFDDTGVSITNIPPYINSNVYRITAHTL